MGKLRVEPAIPRGFFNSAAKLTVTKAHPRPFQPGKVEGHQLGKDGRAFTVFVDGVSKRVPKSAIWEVFEGFGKVSDVYVAYKNQKRLARKDTFAFVWFKDSEGMERAIRDGNKRIIDGFTISVSRAKYSRQPDEKKVGIVEGKSSTSLKYQRAKVSSVRDDRSFKTVLMERRKNQEVFPPLSSGGVGPLVSQDTTNGKEGQEESIESDSLADSEVLSEEVPFEVEREEIEWIERCMVGKISKAFGIYSIQQAMSREEIQCKVAPWNGDRVVVEFISKQGMDRVLLDKWSLFLEWFDSINKINPFQCRKEVLLWVCLYNVPLVVWNPRFFESLADRWGNLVSIDEDTITRTDLEVARILVKAECSAVVPKKFFVSSKGDRWLIRAEVVDWVNSDNWGLSGGYGSTASLEEGKIDEFELDDDVERSVEEANQNEDNAFNVESAPRQRELEKTSNTSSGDCARDRSINVPTDDEGPAKPVTRVLEIANVVEGLGQVGLVNKTQLNYKDALCLSPASNGQVSGQVGPQLVNRDLNGISEEELVGVGLRQALDQAVSASIGSDGLHDVCIREDSGVGLTVSQRGVLGEVLVTPINQKNQLKKGASDKKKGRKKKEIIEIEKSSDIQHNGKTMSKKKKSKGKNKSSKRKDLRRDISEELSEKEKFAEFIAGMEDDEVGSRRVEDLNSEGVKRRAGSGSEPTVLVDMSENLGVVFVDNRQTVEGVFSVAEEEDEEI